MYNSVIYSFKIYRIQQKKTKKIKTGTLLNI